MVHGEIHRSEEKGTLPSPAVQPQAGMWMEGKSVLVEKNHY